MTPPQPNPQENTSPASTDGLGELREKLAAIEHKRWADWQEWMHTKGIWIQIPDLHGNPPVSYLAFSAEYIAHLNQQIETPYEGLSDSEQASDMEQVNRYWPLIEQYLQTQVEWAEELGFVRGYTTAVKAAFPHMTAELAESLRFHHPLFGGHPHKLSKEEQAYFKKIADELGLTTNPKEQK